MFETWIFLLTAIVSEVVTTFSLDWPSVVVIVGYGIVFYCLEVTLRAIPMWGAVGAIWSGQALRRLGLPLLLLALCAAPAAQASKRSEESRMWMTVGERRFAITLTNTPAARAFAAQLPLTLDMADLNGNEKHAELPKALPTDANRPGRIRHGDLMLYGSNTLVVFYVTFDSSYSYTRLGRVDDTEGLVQALGPRAARISFSK